MNSKNFTLDVSVIIVNYNTKQLLADCLKSIYEQTKDIAFEVIVSDNGSTDGSIEMLKNDFPKVILIENNANLGFGTANNRGLAIAIWTKDAIYIFEFKLDGNSEEAMIQINSKNYAISYETDGRKITKIGANFSSETKNLTDWLVE